MPRGIDRVDIVERARAVGIDVADVVEFKHLKEFPNPDVRRAGLPERLRGVKQARLTLACANFAGRGPASDFAQIFQDPDFRAVAQAAEPGGDPARRAT